VPAVTWSRFAGARASRARRDLESVRWREGLRVPAVTWSRFAGARASRARRAAGVTLEDEHPSALRQGPN
jgi:hypothetical protein